MNEIIKKEKELPKSIQVINIEKVDDFIFIETKEKSFMIDKDKHVYEVGNYSHLKNVYHMGDDILAVLEGNHRQDLVNIRTKEVYLSQKNSYYSGIWKIDDDFVHISGPDYEYQPVYNIRTKRFIMPNVEMPVKYGWKLAPNLFVYEINDYEKQIYQKFIIDDQGKLVYRCGEYFPYFKDGNLVLSDRKDNEVVIVRDVLNESQETDMLSKGDSINSNPLIYTNEKGIAEGICFVSKKDFLFLDFDLNVKKRFPLDIEYDSVEIQLWGEISVIIVKKGDESCCIALNLKTGKQVKHYGIWIIPVDAANPNVIRGCDPLDDEYSMYTIYDKDGNEYTHHRAKDCYNIHCKKMNLIRFYGVEGIDGCIVYNIDTREEKVVPWVNPQFMMGDKEYMDYGFGVRYGESWRDEIIDIFDLEFNVVFEGLVSNDFKIRGDDFHYEVNNELLLLTVPVSSGSRTFYKKIVMDKNKNILYDSFDGYLSFVGNFLQIIDEEHGKTYYIDSRTGKRCDDTQITMQEFALPDTINVNGESVRLIKQNVDKTDEY